MLFCSIHGNTTTPFLFLLTPSNSFYARSVQLWQSAVVTILRAVAFTQIFYSVVKRVVVNMVYGVRGCSIVVSPYKSVSSVQNVVYANLMVMMRRRTRKRPSQTSSFSLSPVQTSICVGKQRVQAFFSKVAVSSVHGGSNHIAALYSTGTRPFA